MSCYTDALLRICTFMFSSLFLKDGETREKPREMHKRWSTTQIYTHSIEIEKRNVLYNIISWKQRMRKHASSEQNVKRANQNKMHVLGCVAYIHIT